MFYSPLACVLTLIYLHVVKAAVVGDQSAHQYGNANRIRRAPTPTISARCQTAIKAASQSVAQTCGPQADAAAQSLFKDMFKTAPAFGSSVCKPYFPTAVSTITVPTTIVVEPSQSPVTVVTVLDPYFITITNTYTEIAPTTTTSLTATTTTTTTTTTSFQTSFTTTTTTTTVTTPGAAPSAPSVTFSCPNKDSRERLSNTLGVRCSNFWDPSTTFPRCGYNLNALPPAGAEDSYEYEKARQNYGVYGACLYGSNGRLEADFDGGCCREYAIIGDSCDPEPSPFIPVP